MAKLKEKIPHENYICTNCFKSLGVPTKIELYSYIKNHGDVNVKTLVEQVKLTQPTVSHHLHDMVSSGLLKSKKLGKEVHFSINSECPVHKQACILQSVRFPLRKK